MTIHQVIDALTRKGHKIQLCPNGHQAQLNEPGIKRVFSIVQDDGPELEIETTTLVGTSRLRYFSIKSCHLQSR